LFSAQSATVQAEVESSDARLVQYTSLTWGFGVFFSLSPDGLAGHLRFNSSNLVTVWAGFFDKGYGELLQNDAFPECCIGNA